MMETRSLIALSFVLALRQANAQANTRLSTQVNAQVIPIPPAACDTAPVQVIAVAGGRVIERRIFTHCRPARSIDTLTLGGASARTLSAALVGRVPSPSVLQSSGVLGSGSRVRFRGGYGLIIPREPLLIIDGVRVDGSQTSLGLDVGGQTPSRLDDISVEDIDRIQVLPGPSATAVYGANAAGGVILVRTKRGVPGPLKWRSYIESGVASDAGSYPDNVATGAPTYGESACTRADAARGLCVAGPVSRWNPLEQASPFRTGVRVAGGASVVGGSNRIRYYVGADAAQDQGPLAPNDQRRYSTRGNLDLEPSSRLRFAFGGSQLVSTTTLPFGTLGIGVLRSGLMGNTADDPVLRGYLQLDPATIETISTQQHITRSTGSVTATWLPINRITVSGLASREVGRRDDSRTFPLAAAFLDPALDGPWNYAGSTGRDMRTTFGASAAVAYSLFGSFGAVTRVGVERLSVSLRTRDSIQRFLQDGTPIGSSRRWADAQSNRVGLYASQQFGTKWRRLDLTIRRDGRDDRYLLAPSTSWSVRGQWDLASAEFLEARSWLRGVSLHAGYGVVADARPYMALLESSPAIVGSSPTQITLPEFRSEHVSELEIGGNLRHGDLIDLDLTAYRQHSGDAYEPGCCIASVGYDDAGRWHTIGAELALRSLLRRTFHSEWRVQFTASLAHNEYDNADVRNRRIDGMLYASPAGRRLVRGYPIGGASGHPLVGRDANGDGVIIPAEISRSTDSVYLGAAVPTRQAALATTFNRRRLTLSALVDYQGGHTILNETEAWRCAVHLCDALYDPGASLSDQTRAVSDFQQSPGFIEHADFARVREVAITYALAPSWAYRMGIQRLDLTLSGRNLWTLTGYSGIDPEVNVAGQTTFGSVEHFTQPIPRTFIARVSLHR